MCLSLFYLCQTAYYNTAIGEISKAKQCDKTSLEAKIDSNASREENLERLTEEFFQSVNKVQQCDYQLKLENDNPSKTMAASSGATDGNEKKDNNGQSNKLTNPSSNLSAKSQETSNLASQKTDGRINTNHQNPTASSSLVGTNFEQAAITPETRETSEKNVKVGETKTFENDTEGREEKDSVSDQALTNGKIPDDIPDADNDSVFETQIRAAAIAETDPKTREKLWNEYRKYKGLPERK